MIAAVEQAPANFRRGARRTWHQRRRHAAVRRLAETMSGDALDYGCGWGEITHLMAPQFRSIVGVDVSPDRVAFARQQFAPLPFSVCPPEGLPFRDASFDAVLSVVVLPFVSDTMGYLRECRRVLRPGGKLLLVSANPHGNLELLYRIAGRPPHRSWRRLPSLATLLHLLTELGFTTEASDGFYDPPFDRLTNPREMVLACMNVVGHLSGRLERATYVGLRAVRGTTS